MSKWNSNGHSGARRVLSVVLALVMVLSMLPSSIVMAGESEGTALYLKPNANWLKDGARFAVYYWNGAGSAWADMTDEDGDGIYEGTVPAGYTNIIFCRMNPNTTTNDWPNKWNQTSDLTVPTDGTNCYTVADDTWDNGGGEWSVHTPVVEEPKLYLKPNANWLKDGARFALYYWDDAGSAWVDMTDEDGDGYYECVQPEGYTNVIFCRMNPNTTTNDWPNKWNQTSDLTVPTDGTNCYTVADDTWDNGGGTWSVYPPEEAGGETAAEYYLYGFINGADVTSNDYKFENGELTITFTAADNYVFVKNSAGATYMTDGWLGFEATSATLGTSYSSMDKLYVPAGEYVFTLAENSDGTLTLSYTSPSAEPDTAGYYLVGYINGADYGCNDDYANLGEYKFVDGKLTATFTQDSYVFVKTGDNANWYMAEAYSTATSVTLKNTTTGTAEKLFVPGNVELTFTLAENADGSLTLSYTRPSVAPGNVEYYLEGYINNSDYTGTDYKFVDGKVTVAFNATSYVYVKGSNGVTYMTNGWLGENVTTATLYDATTLASGDKLMVSGGGELTFTLVENADGSLTLSCAPVAVEPEIPEGYESVTIHFLKPDGWGGTINAYVWTADGALAGYEAYNTWPGKAVSPSASYPGFYDLVVAQEKVSAFNFIFNDGSNQTSDLTTGEITGTTELWVINNEVLTEAPDYTVNLHFQKPETWGDTINAYAWTDAGNLLGNWPGTAAAADTNNAGWYDMSLSMATDDGFSFIFNDGSGNQTGDLSTGALRIVTDLWIVNGQVLTAAPKGWFDANRTVHIPGTFPGPSWDASSNQMTYDPALGLYVYTFENVPAGSYEFKIAINGGWGENYGAGGAADGSNISVVVPTAQDVTVWYNDETHYAVTSVTYVMDADITLSGTGVAEGTKLTDPGLTGLYTVAVTLSAGTYSDLTITYGDYTYTFGAFELKEDREVNFYFDPATYLAYHDGSDKKVDTSKIYYTTKDLEYKDPFGAVAVGEEVTFSIDTGVDATGVTLIVAGLPAVPMVKDGEAAEGVQRWTGTTTFSALGEYKYYFAISNGSDLIFYCDDNYNNYYKKGDYGTGTTRDLANVFAYDLVVYAADFETPDWMKNAVIYQIFPDRFFDGDESNNTAQIHARGTVNYEYVTDWYLLPENPEMASDPNYPDDAYSGDGQWSNEIYGGDLQGIIEKIDYLKALGVNVIYLNPVFSSISNHRYDACDYMEIDPILGTLGDFEELVAVAEANDMHIILDGVFNHVSDDSVYFDRYYRFLGTSEKIGAYPYWAHVYDLMNEEGMTQADAEAAAKEYFGENYGITDYSYTEWFGVNNEPMTSVDTVGLRAGKYVYSYEGWWGYDSMPVIKSTNGSEFQTGNWADEIIYNEDGSSVTQYWIAKGNDGWRLDVANEVSDETWQNFRDSVKALNSDAVIIGEIWADATKYLMGDMYDSVMNYVFRDAVAGFARGYLINRDNKAEKYDADLTADEAMTVLEILRERYPEEAFYAMMNLVASHDTARILSYLDDVEDDRYQKDIANSFPRYETTSDRAKELQYVVSFLQFTYAGAPTIYYGDEIGMVGADDPDDRRAFTWGKGNQDIVEWYAELAAVRAEYTALRTGSVEPFSSGSADVMSFVRRDSSDALIVLANRAASAKSITLNLAELGIEGDTLTDLISGDAYTAVDGVVTISVDAYRGAILTAGEVKTVTVDYDGLKDAYDPAYIVAARSEVPAESVRYAVIQGADQEITAQDHLTVTVEGVINTFETVLVDGEEVPSQYYTVKTGVVVTLSPEFLASLELGEHTLTVVFNGGTAETTFTIVEEKTPEEDDTKPEEDPTKPEEDTTAPEEDDTKPEDGTTAPEEDDTKPEETTKPEDGTTGPGSGSDENVKTGDDSMILVSTLLLTISLAGVVILLMLNKKRMASNR